ncbi:O-antigen ligase family protein [Patescibacteria group bacterium]
MKLNKLRKQLTWMKVCRFCFYAFVFLLPLQINVIVYATPIFESGNFNQITSFFLYLTDFLFLAAFICWGIAIFKNEFKEKITYGKSAIAILLVLFLIIAEVSVLFAEDQWLSFAYVIRFVELILMYFFVVNKTVKINTIINVFIASVSLQALLAVIQYLYQGSVGFAIFGEPQISADIPGVAKIQLEENTLMRPYGTLPHPNILAGYLLAGILFAYHRIRQKEYIAYPLLILMSAALVLAFSRGAFLAILVAFLVYISLKNSRISIKYILFSLSILIFFVVLFNLEQSILTRLFLMDDSSLTDRVFYFNISKQMMYAIPFGIGLGNFTLLMSDFTSAKLAPWDFQPVHNIYMLITNEMGVFGFIVFVLLLVSFAVLIFLAMKKADKHKRNLGAILISLLTALCIIGLFDHYLISLYHGQALLFLMFAVFGSYAITSKSH